MNRLIKVIIVLQLFAFAFNGHTQTVFKNRTFKDYIATVKFSVKGLPVSLPIANLNSGGQIRLSFDDLEGGYKYYRYKFIHCDKDWTESNMESFDYLNGFEDEEIENYQTSISTKIKYTHYWLDLPNENMSWTKSGNYILIIYEEGAEDDPVLWRRFLVVEDRAKIIAECKAPTDVSILKTHHEIDFNIRHKGFNIENPKRDIRVTILQNGRWDNALTDIKNRMVRQDELDFEYNNELVFPAGKEFRSFDIRSLKSRSERVYSIEEFTDAVEATLETDINRSFSNLVSHKDINGYYVIANDDKADDQVTSEYVWVNFSLESRSELYNSDVYVIGGFSDWQIQNYNQLNYDEDSEVYYKDILLKQGFYDYIYVVHDKDRDVLDFSTFEGNWFGAKNQYTILVYYRPIGENYDQLISAFTVESN